MLGSAPLVRRSLLSGLMTLSFFMTACSDEPGRSVVRLDDEAAGANCAGGGTAIRMGPDTDGDGVLSDAEAASGSTRYFCHPVTVDPLAALVKSTPIEPGADCKYGGSKIESGLDDDRDGALDEAEVDATELLCNGRTMDVVFYGDLHAESAADLKAIEGKEIIVGNVYVDTYGFEATELTFPHLTQIVGEFALYRNGPEAQEGEKQIETVRLPALKRAGNLYFELSRLKSLEMPELEHLDSLEIDEAGLLKTFVLPKLQQTNGGLELDEAGSLATFSLPELQRGGGIYLYDADALTTLSLPKLTQLRNSLDLGGLDMLTELHLPLLTEIGDTLYVGSNNALASFTLPELTTAGYVNIESNELLASVSLPKLTTVHSAFYGWYNPELVTLSVPTMARVGGELYVSVNNHLTAFSAPELTEVGRLYVQNNLQLTEVSLPKLAMAHWNGVYVQSNPAMSQCKAAKLERSMRKLGYQGSFFNSANLADTSCTANTAADCTPVMVDGVATSFHFCEIARTFDNARLDCQAIFPGGDLAHFEGMNEFQQVSTVITGLGYFGNPWIGFTDLGTEGSWRWLSGATAWVPATSDADVWNNAEPNNAGSNEHCGQFSRTGGEPGQLNDYVCSAQNTFICRAP